MNVVYRDLKPENLLIEANGYLKLVDFGISKQLDGDITYTFCGTPEYISPEMISNQGHGKAVDWWSLGILMYEMLFGQPPFYSIDIERTYDLILNAEVNIINNRIKVSKDCEDLILRLLDKNPKTRIGSNGIEEIKAHKFFSSVNFEGLLNFEVPAPFTPNVTSNYDINNFPDEFIYEESNDSMIGGDALIKIEKVKSVFDNLFN